MYSVSEDSRKLLIDMKHYHSSSDFGLYKDEQKSNRIIFWVKCTLVLVGLSSVFFVILHFAINTRKEARPLSNSTSNAEVTEKFIFPQMDIDTFPTVGPKPFDVKSSGLHPHRFMPTLPTTSRTTLRGPSLKYPQLTSYRNYQSPRSIQDVLRFITESPAPSNNEKRQAPDTRRVLGRMKGLGLVDPLLQYKPNDPSEVNLLATGDFRFSPPVWKDFQRFNQVRQNTLQQHNNPPQIGNQMNIGNNLTPPHANVNLVGNSGGSMNMPSNPRDVRFSQVRQQAFQHQTIPIMRDYIDNQGYGNKPSVQAAGSFPELVKVAANSPDNEVNGAPSGDTGIEGMFKKPFIVTLAVYPGVSWNQEPKSSVPDFRPLQDENNIRGGASAMHMFLQVFPSMSHPTVYQK